MNILKDQAGWHVAAIRINTSSPVRSCRYAYGKPNRISPFGQPGLNVKDVET